MPFFAIANNCLPVLPVLGAVVVALALLDYLGKPLDHPGVGVVEEARGLGVKRGDLGHLGVRERKVKDIEVLLHALAVH